MSRGRRRWYRSITPTEFIVGHALAILAGIVLALIVVGTITAALGCKP